MKLNRIIRRLAREVNELEFDAPVTHVYNPLDYAWAVHKEYLDRFGERTGRVFMMGMNPGPFGMAQTGIPFGEVAAVRDWMGLTARVKRPTGEHPKRPVEGFDCARSEVSGRRLWGWAAERFGTPKKFFRHFFVHNYCPLVFMEESGRNRTPDKLAREERDPLYEICDRALAAMVDALEPSLVIGVGTFAEARAKQVLGDREIPVARILHPSPASPRANQGWEKIVEGELAALAEEYPQVGELGIAPTR